MQHRSPFRALSLRRFRRVPLALFALVAFAVSFAALSAQAQDRQVVQVGNGLAGTLCVSPGLDGVRDSNPGGDDVVPPGSQNIESGPNGICESVPNSLNAGGDDVHPTDISFGQGGQFKRVILPQADNVCRSFVVIANDDVWRVPDPTTFSPVGSSIPRRVGVRPDPDTTIESTPGDDDTLTSLICPGSDGTIESVPTGGDSLPTSDDRCGICPGPTGGCIVPDASDVFHTTVAATDIKLDYISTGPDGICDTAHASTDVNAIPLNQGASGTVCVDSGADGIADSTLCGNGTVDIDENGIFADAECEDSNLTSGDGCSSICQPEYCGDGITQAGLGEQCDDSGESATCDANCTFVSCGDGDTNTTVGEECDDGGGNSNTTPDACRTDCSFPVCGDNIIDPGFGEQCDDGPGNSDTLPDACRTNCKTASCGDGVLDPSNSEVCDDGDNKNNDDCVLGCVAYSCGDGFKHTKGTPPFEGCDDGNTTAGDGCSPTCTPEVPAECGNGVIDLACTGGLVGNSCTTNVDCDSAPASGDGVCTPEECDDGNNSDKDDCRITCNAAVCGDGAVKTKGTPPFEECDDGNLNSGDGCSSTCVQECGNALIDGACSQGTVGSYCNTNVDCDSAPASGDGVCATEACDWAISGLCVPGPGACSGVCTVASCGNEEVECGEQCDLGVSNGVPGSGCTAVCARNLVGSKEISGIQECPGAWTLDSAPEDLRHKKQTCQDGAACDFDASANGECVFSVGICVNRGDPAGCAQGSVFAIDVLRLKTGVPYQAAAAEVLTDALGALTSDSYDAPGRCREGKRRKNCSINTDCDTFLGAGDGICDVATGVSYSPSLVATGVGANQVSACTPGEPVAVPVGQRLKLRLYVRRDDGLRGDKDSLKLVCEP